MSQCKTLYQSTHTARPSNLHTLPGPPAIYSYTHCQDPLQSAHTTRTPCNLHTARTPCNLHTLPGPPPICTHCQDPLQSTHTARTSSNVHTLPGLGWWRTLQSKRVACRLAMLATHTYVHTNAYIQAMLIII